MTTKQSEMTSAVRQKLASMPRSSCAKCHSIKSYTNPMAKCWECKRKFCFDHISCLQVKDGMKQSDEVRNVCKECIEKHGYRTMC